MAVREALTRSPSAIGTVVAAHGRRGIVASDGERLPFLTRGRRLRVVCGDRVRFEAPAAGGEALVVGIEPRDTALARSGARPGEDEVVAANLTQLIAVSAPRPAPDWFLMDRYLCAAELIGCRPLVVWNKADIEAPGAAPLEEFRQLGYTVLAVSAKSAAGLAELAALMDAQTSVLVGQSGVGKSSLINALVPEAEAAIGALSAASATGTHTTTAALMYDVGSTGHLIDTPGTRSFVPAVATPHLDHGFPELRRLAAGCRFADCSHSHEPGCAVKEALERGAISARRYDSYRRLQALISPPGR